MTICKLVNGGSVRDFSHVSLGDGTPREREMKTCLWRWSQASLSSSVVVFKNCTLFRVWHLACQDYRIKIIYMVLQSRMASETS